MADQKQTSNDTLQHFSCQLQSWCSERLNQKPGPFRQVEMCRDIICNQEILSFPIVLWVNRESFLAGGLLVLPRYRDEEIFVSGRELARIYGLPCFYSWGRHEISCWSTAYDPPEKLWEYELPHDEITSPAMFRKSLNILLERMESSFFEFQLQIPEVSLPYLLNLVHATMKDILPDLKQALQIEQSASETEVLADGTASNLLFLKLLLPIVLTASNIAVRTPGDRSICDELVRFAGQLPESLRYAFEKLSTFPTFPETCHRRLIHFVNRIQQLQSDLASEIVPLLKHLLAVWASELGGYTSTGVPGEQDLVVINPSTPTPLGPGDYEIAPAAILAANAAIRHFADEKQNTGIKQLTSPLELTTRLANHHVLGTLAEHRQPTVTEQKKLNALLRLSWPHQKLSLSARTPIWVWHFLHLCGLSDGSSRLDITIPANWLWERYGEQIAPILLGHLHISEIAAIEANWLHCKLLPVREAAATDIHTDDGRTRQLKGPLPMFLRSQILTTMKVPDELFNLLVAGDLQYCESDRFSELSLDGLFNYLSSSLGRNFWRLLAPGRPLPRKDKIATECARAGIPLPNAKILAALGKLTGKGSQPSIADIDQELTVWLGATSPLDLEQQQNNRRTKTAATEDQEEKFISNCKAEEIPRFPDDYTYHVPSAERVNYEFEGRLEIVDSFFDQVILRDQQKMEVTVLGTKQAEALILVSSSASGPLQLPASQLETANILDRYIEDLKKLRQAFYRHAVIFLPEEQTGKMVDNLWRKLSLPDWNLVRNK